MSKYNVGDKFIIEISKNNTNELDTTEYYITNGSRVYEKEELDRLQKYDEEQIPYSEAYNIGVQDGRNEVWELSGKLCSLKFKDICKIFEVLCSKELFEKLTPQEALAKLEVYEKEEAAFKRGDIVEFVDTDELAIYIGQYADGTHAVVFDECNVPQKVSTDEIRKTDKHIDIQSVLEGDNK